MRKVKLTRGLEAIVDNKDFELVSKLKWRAVKGWKTYYAIAWLPKINGKRRTISMHRFILGLAKGEYADHKNGNGLDNRRSKNIRKCTNRQNAQNASPRKNAISQFKGVGWCKQTRKWTASIRINGKPKWLGRFSDEKAAAVAYNYAAKKHFGKFARINKI